LNSRLKAQRDFDVTLYRQPYLDHIWDRAQYYDSSRVTCKGAVCRTRF
jgi:hypothetical protein